MTRSTFCFYVHSTNRKSVQLTCCAWIGSITWTLSFEWRRGSFYWNVWNNWRLFRKINLEIRYRTMVILTTRWQLHDHMMTTAWLHDCSYMITLWQLRDHTMTTTCSHYDNYMITIWQLRDHTMEASRSHDDNTLLCDHMMAATWLHYDNYVITWWQLRGHTMTTTWS